MKDNLKSFGYYTPTERRAVLLLLFIILLLFVIPETFFRAEPADQKLNAEDAAWIRQSLEKIEPNVYVEDQKRGQRQKRLKLTRFDPNQVNAGQLEAMGLAPALARNWGRYLEKGGRFRNVGGVRKIYGMTESVFQELRPWMSVEESQQPKAFKATFRERYSGGERPERSFPGPCREVEVNLADSAAWEYLPGIGPVLAARIVKFRDRLGGFVSIEQVKETYGLPDSTFQRIKPCLVLKGPLRQLAINELGEEDLRGHPYIGYKLAKAIVAYRQNHGPFSSRESLLDIPVVSRESWERLFPYLLFGNATAGSFGGDKE